MGFNEKTFSLFGSFAREPLALFVWVLSKDMNFATVKGYGKCMNTVDMKEHGKGMNL